MVLHILYMSGAMGMYTSCTCMGKQHVALDLSEARGGWNRM